MEVKLNEPIQLLQKKSHCKNKMQELCLFHFAWLIVVTLETHTHKGVKLKQLLSMLMGNNSWTYIWNSLACPWGWWSIFYWKMLCGTHRNSLDSALFTIQPMKFGVYPLLIFFFEKSILFVVWGKGPVDHPLFPHKAWYPGMVCPPQGSCALGD